MLNKRFIFIFTTTLFIILLAVQVVHAQGLKEAGEILEKDVAPQAGVTQQKDLAGVVGAGINVALSLVGLIFMVLMIYAGYLWMTAEGEEEKIKKAQKIITAAVIGLVIVLAAYAITFLVTSKLGA